MEGLTCMKCKQTSSIPPSAQHIRCFGCGSVYSVGHSNDNDDAHVMVNYKGTTECSLDFTKKKAEAKLICHSLRRKLPFSTQASPPLAINISMTEQPRRGRRAFLCGVTYRKQKHQLKGTAHDVNNIRDLLLQRYHFPKESILTLAEEESYNPPTKKNIEDGFKWLIRGIQPGDSLVFYFSGHGKRQREFNGDERDGFDETICPVDFETSGMILDNDINEAIVRPLIQDVKLHAIIDSCHSGTVLDLPQVYDITTGKWEDNSPPSGAYKGTKGGTAICFSACEDYQLAADTSAFSPEKEMTGAMTITFILAVKAALDKNESITYQDIMDSMHQTIKQASKSGGFFAGIRRFFHRRILQDPVLSSSEEFNTNTEFKL
ncbi:metacaspase 1 [Perilla frutescens var. hirtella]|uniref:Metacaspase 1 n=1 Tax=Perilla frutescens var. hirtella TaxID=608512 RepID=A0AAD4PBG0_PERFH|nr:metacaspase 1 [Perilla frutescens var. hirtella]